MSVNAAPFIPRMSPTAAPFVPRSFSMKVSAIEKPVTLSASAEEFVPRIFRNIQQVKKIKDTHLYDFNS